VSTVKFRLSVALAFGLLGGTSSATEPFPVEPFPYPFRSVAAEGDFSAVRFNPASLGFRQEVEFAWHHKFSGHPSGFNAVTMRAKSVGVSVSWLDDAVYGKRREYLFSAGKSATREVALGASFRWLKADDSLLQDRTLWTFAAAFNPAPAWSVAARWENALHTKVGGTATDGTWIFGVRSAPFRDRAEFTLDWIYPESASPADTDLRFAVRVSPTLGVDLRGFIDTRERVGLELTMVVERSKGGAEARMHDYSEYQDGTLYLTVLNSEYPDARRRPGKRE
jgi:hypothetical protein